MNFYLDILGTGCSIILYYWISKLDFRFTFHVGSYTLMQDHTQVSCVHLMTNETLFRFHDRESLDLLLSCGALQHVSCYGDWNVGMQHCRLCSQGS